MGSSTVLLRRTSATLARRVLPALGLVAAGLFGLAPTAWADVSVTPARAEQGEGIDVRFRVSNDRPGTHTTRVEVQLPEDTPVAEAYAMTTSDWAPQTLYRKVDQPLRGIHGSGLTTVTSAVIWTRVDAATTIPATEELRLEMGPMPEAASYIFTVIQAYADGTVKRWQGPTPAGGTAIALTPAAAGADGSGTSASGSHHAQGQTAGQDDGGGSPAVLPVAPVAAAEPTEGTSFVGLMSLGAAGTLGAGVTGIVGMLLLARGNARHRSAPDPAVPAPAASLPAVPALERHSADAGQDQQDVSVAVGPRWR